MVKPTGSLLDAPAPAALIDAEAARSLAQTLSTWQTVDRRQVHKSALSEVLVTDLHELESDLYAVALQWPRWHPFYRPRPDQQPHPLLFVESLRQAGIYLTHQSLGVPLTQQFVFQAIEADYAPEELQQLPREAATIVLALRTRPKVCGGGRSGTIRLDIEAWCNAQRLATATAKYRCLSAEAYARVRAHGLAEAASVQNPAFDSASRPGPADPDGGEQSLLQVNYGNPVFFDHPVDHLPGMLLMDAALSAAGLGNANAWPQLRHFQMTFSRYGELRLPTLVTTRGGQGRDQDLVSVTISQNDRTAATSTVRLIPHGGERAGRDHN